MSEEQKINPQTINPIKDKNTDKSFISKGEKDSKGPRTFTWWQKEECWNRATFMIGRDPDRWRLDAVGNPVFKQYRGCKGPVCHEYDHIIPFSKGGKTVMENCQLLQSKVNLYKSNKIDVGFDELRTASPEIRLSNDQMDALEIGAYGDVKKSSYVDLVQKQKDMYKDGGKKTDSSDQYYKKRGRPRKEQNQEQKNETTNQQ